MKIIMPKISFVISLACNLRCKLCVIHAPYHTKIYHPSFGELCRQADRFFEVVDHVGCYSLTGGEPLLRKDLPAILDYIRNKYIDRIDVFELVTNGSIVPNEDLLESINNCGGKVRFMLDDYGPTLSTNFETVADKIRQTEATLRIDTHHGENLYCDGWVDFGTYPLKQNRGTEYAKDVFLRCAQPQKLKFCVSLIDGVLYPCVQSYNLLSQGISPPETDVIDLFAENYSDDDLRKKISDIYYFDMLSACAYCDGMCEDSTRYTPAEQLPLEKL